MKTARKMKSSLGTRIIDQDGENKGRCFRKYKLETFMS